MARESMPLQVVDGGVASKIYVLGVAFLQSSFLGVGFATMQGLKNPK